MNYTRIADLHAALAAEFRSGAGPDPQPPDPGPGPQPPEPQPPEPEPPASGFRIVTLTWGQPLSWPSRDHGGFNCPDVLVFAVAVPAGTSGSWRLQVSEFGDPPYIRQMVMSRTAGSFDPVGMLAQSQGTSVGITIPGALYAGQMVYLRLRNWSTDLGGPSCPVTVSTNLIANFQGG